MRPSEKGHVPLQAGMYLTDGYRIDPKMQRDYLNHPLDNQGWLGRPTAAVRIAAAKQIDFERCRLNIWVLPDWIMKKRCKAVLFVAVSSAILQEMVC